MESLGDKLKTARESKGYTFDYIGRETNIAIRYLEALETENFSAFPGEPYLLGFLRNYGEYLGLDVDELLFLYRGLKIQEEPVPIEKLLRSPSKVPKILLTVFVTLAGLAAVGGGVYFFMNVPWKKDTAVAAQHSPVAYTLEGNFLERRLYRGDSVLIPLGGNLYKIDLLNLGEAVTLSAPMGNVILDLGQEINVDINSDGLGDVRIGAQDFVRNDPAIGVMLRFDLSTDMGTISEGTGAEILPPADTASAAPESPAGSLSNAVTIFTSSNAYPFTLQASFQGYCMFRWEILRERDRQDRQEQYFSRTEELNIQVQNYGVRIWVSNAMAVKLQVSGGGRTVPLEIGGAGEVVVADVYWVRENDGRYRLILNRID
ncbi:transcriptional regulator [Spirochaetia bacterium]|nr:transcriptional regulator [Spirochaetia bacterium]